MWTIKKMKGMDKMHISEIKDMICSLDNYGDNNGNNLRDLTSKKES